MEDLSRSFSVTVPFGPKSPFVSATWTNATFFFCWLQYPLTKQTQNTFRIQSSFQIVGWAWSSFYRKKKKKKKPHQCHTAKNKLFGCLGISFQKFWTFCTNNCVSQSQWLFRLASTQSNIKNHNNSNNGWRAHHLFPRLLLDKQTVTDASENTSWNGLGTVFTLCVFFSRGVGDVFESSLFFLLENTMRTTSPSREDVSFSVPVL